MLGSAVSSSTPRDLHPSSVMGSVDRPLMKRHGPPGVALGCTYAAVGMQRALDSAIGLPRRSTSASWMLAFLIPESVSRSFMMPFPELCRRPVSEAVVGLAERVALGMAVRLVSPVDALARRRH